ncbi:MAG: hypothetical protein KKA19_07925 [Candidatus Margulisbacteria bacterium]|nr:hypothetical protein [Candidatus Margulisiibacteriota bacterium]
MKKNISYRKIFAELQWIIIALILLVFALGNIKWAGTEYIGLREYLPRYYINDYPPKALLYSAITPEYLKDTAEFWAKKVGISGFIITTLPSNWYEPTENINQYFLITKQMNQICRNKGIDANFIRIGLGHRTLPDYFNDLKWGKILEKVKSVAKFAKATNFRGIALDTEAYTGELWNSSKGTLANYPKAELKKKIYQRGREIMQQIVQEFPEAELFVFPVGHLYAYTKKGSSKYELWIDFFNGLASIENERGIILGSERTYRIIQKNKLLHYYYDEIKGPIIGDNINNPNFWYEKCSIALGAWPLGKTYSDKSAWYNSFFFNRQFRTMEMTCPKYVWIYAHGSAWWQEKNIEKYRLHKEAALPTVKNIQKYYAVVRKSKEASLKKYYYAVKYGRVSSILEIILGNLGF